MGKAREPIQLFLQYMASKPVGDTKTLPRPAAYVRHLDQHDFSCTNNILIAIAKEGSTIQNGNYGTKSRMK